MAAAPATTLCDLTTDLMLAAGGHDGHFRHEPCPGTPAVASRRAAQLAPRRRLVRRRLPRPHFVPPTAGSFSAACATTARFSCSCSDSAPRVSSSFTKLVVDAVQSGWHQRQPRRLLHPPPPPSPTGTRRRPSALTRGEDGLRVRGTSAVASAHVAEPQDAPARTARRGSSLRWTGRWLRCALPAWAAAAAVQGGPVQPDVLRVRGAACGGRRRMRGGRLLSLVALLRRRSAATAAAAADGGRPRVPCGDGRAVRRRVASGCVWGGGERCGVPARHRVPRRVGGRACDGSGGAWVAVEASAALRACGSPLVECTAEPARRALLFRRDSPVWFPPHAEGLRQGGDGDGGIFDVDKIERILCVHPLPSLPPHHLLVFVC